MNLTPGLEGQQAQPAKVERIYIRSSAELLIQTAVQFESSKTRAEEIAQLAKVREAYDFAHRAGSDYPGEFLTHSSPPPGYKKHEPVYQELSRFEDEQYALVRQIVERGVTFYADREGIPKPRAVYWGAGLDKFVDGFRRGRWFNVGLYRAVVNDIPDTWAYSANGKDLQKGVRMQEHPTAVEFDVTGRAVPTLIGVDSVDVSLLKTVGGGFDENAFWGKIMIASKDGALVISSDKVPTNFQRHFKPYEEIAEQIGGTKIEMNAPVMNNSMYGGYIAREFRFYRYEG